MQRRLTTLVGAVVVVFALWIAARSFHMPKPVGRGLPSGISGASADDGGGLMYAYGDAGQVSGDGGSFGWSDLVGGDMRSDGGAGTLLPDGSPVPPLPVAIPRQIRFGVVLVSYAGAQPNPTVGRPTTRSKGDARLLADKLLATAQMDFHAAVQQGDIGSADDIGQIKPGIVEPAPEYVLFTLPVDGVGGPVDTPRGYWIVKRLE
jgi:hypothetical protein